MHPCIAGCYPAASPVLLPERFGIGDPLAPSASASFQRSSPEMCPYTVSCSTERLIVLLLRQTFSCLFFSVHHPQICMRFGSMSLPGICGIYKGTWPEVYKRIDGFPFFERQGPHPGESSGCLSRRPGTAIPKMDGCAGPVPGLVSYCPAEGKMGKPSRLADMNLLTLPLLAELLHLPGMDRGLRILRIPCRSSDDRSISRFL